jgi:hypothetical protein
MRTAAALEQVRSNRYLWILNKCIDGAVRQIGEMGLMEKRKLARRWAGEVSLPELVDRLELALTEVTPGASVFKALSVLSLRLGSPGETGAVQKSRSGVSRRARHTAVESLPLFS